MDESLKAAALSSHERWKKRATIGLGHFRAMDPFLQPERRCPRRRMSKVHSLQKIQEQARRQAASLITDSKESLMSDALAHLSAQVSVPASAITPPNLDDTCQQSETVFHSSSGAHGRVGKGA